MSEFTLLSAILRGVWLIDPTWANNNLALIANIIKGKTANFGNTERRSDEQRIAVLTREAGNLYTPSYYSGFDNAPKGSIAKIDLIGPVMKYGFCSDGSYELNQLVQEAKASPNIKGLFIENDSPGGQVDGSASLADSIRNFGKPTINFVNDGMMASAAVWIGTSAVETYASQKLDSIGSIGVYQTIYDQSERLKQMGIKKIDRYAPQSTEKNRSYKDAMKGKFDIVDAELEAICDLFISTIETNRGARLQGDPADWNKGQLGFADWAQDIGLIDGICSFADAVDRLDELCGGAPSLASSTTSSKYSFNPPSNNMKFTYLTALSNVKAPTDAQIDKANGDLTEADITAVTLVRESFIQDAADATSSLEKVTGELAEANETIADLKESRKKLKAKIDAKDDKIEELEAKIEAFGKNAGANHKGTKETVQVQPDNNGDADPWKLIDGLKHNQTADALIGAPKVKDPAAAATT